MVGPQTDPPGALALETASRIEIDKRLRAALRPVIDGSSSSGGSVAITGPAGIGKTHLLSTFIEETGSSAAQVLTARGDPVFRRKSFAVVSDLVGEPPGHEDPAEFLFDRVDALCASGPALVCVDDVHQVDAASLRALRRLVWATRHLPLAVLLVGRTHPARDQVAVVIQQAQLRLQLGAMDSILTETLVHSLTGRWPSTPLMRALDAAGGNPLFIKELIRSLRSQRLLHPAGVDRLTLTDEHIELGAELGPLVQDLLQQMDDDYGLELLGALAVLATPASLSDVAELLFTSTEDLRPALERLGQSGLVTVQSASTDDLVGISHDVYRDAAYELMDAPTRLALHRRAAELLRTNGASPAVVAEHLMRAADRSGPTADLDVELALWKAARETNDFAVAAELLAEVPTYSTAAEQVDSAASEQAHALFMSGQMRQAVELAQAQLPVTTDPATQSRLFQILLRSQVDGAQSAAALRTIEGLLESPHLPPGLRREMEQLHAWVRVLSGDWRDAAAEVSASLPALTEGGHRDAQARALVSLSCAAHLDGRSLEASTLIERQFALQVGDVQEQSTALIWPPMFELFTRGVDPARERIQEVRRRSQELGASWLSPYHCFVAAGIAFTAGDWDHAVAEYTAGLELAEESGSGWISIAVGQLAYMEAHRGNVNAAHDRLRRFSSRRLPLQFGMDDPGWGGLAAQEAAGDPAAAAAYARDFWAAAPAGGRAWMLQVAPDVSRVGLVARAPRLCARVAEQVSEIDLSGCPAVAHNADLVVGMSTGDVDLIESAATQAASYGHHVTAAQAFEEASCAAAAAGQAQRSRDRMDDALALYDQMGAAADRDRLLARTRALGVRRGSRQKHRSARSGPTSLTATEVRVAGLVREGLTNPEIGARLFLSPRTVQVHVSHILAKLNLRSRVEVAAILTPEVLATELG